jgi:glycerol-3-phosphate dehydrogenase
MASLGTRLDVAVPIAEQVAALTRGEADVAGAVAALMARPLREE